ncbi:MAG: hypothetical protein HC777_00580 [Hyphomonadaceae bacterium]|nr:hypothetical protein [Hyphomonadaceae bacterium]
MSDKTKKLDAWYDQIDAIFLSRVSPLTGLLPASTAKTVHGDYAHAWVRDNVYSVLGIWGLAAAHRRHNHAPPTRRATGSHSCEGHARAVNRHDEPSPQSRAVQANPRPTRWLARQI